MSTPKDRPGGLPAAAIAALGRGDPIAAVKLVREATGLGLKDAKDALEAWQRAGTPPAAGAMTGGPAARTALAALPAEAVAALRAGRKLEAIRIVRAAAGIGLKEAREAVDDFERRQPGGLTPAGAVQAGGGNGSGLAWAIGAIAAATLGWWFFGRG